MTLFGRTLGVEEIASLVFMLMALTIWIAAWRGERDWGRWFRRWEADKKSRREAELATEETGERPPSSSSAPRGPWG